MGKIRTWVKSSITGRFVKDATARRHPDTTYEQTAGRGLTEEQRLHKRKVSEAERRAHTTLTAVTEPGPIKALIEAVDAYHAASPGALGVIDRVNASIAMREAREDIDRVIGARK